MKGDTKILDRLDREQARLEAEIETINVVRRIMGALHASTDLPDFTRRLRDQAQHDAH